MIALKLKPIIATVELPTSVYHHPLIGALKATKHIMIVPKTNAIRAVRSVIRREKSPNA